MTSMRGRGARRRVEAHLARRFLDRHTLPLIRQHALAKGRRAGMGRLSPLREIGLTSSIVFGYPFSLPQTVA
jgi:hypothetical protein